MQGCAYVDGDYIAPEDAKISIFDWGFLHSDATYDVTHVWKGWIFRLDDHLARFERNMAALRMKLPFSRAVTSLLAAWNSASSASVWADRGPSDVPLPRLSTILYR